MAVRGNGKQVVEGKLGACAINHNLSVRRPSSRSMMSNSPVSQYVLRIDAYSPAESSLWGMTVLCFEKSWPHLHSKAHAISVYQVPNCACDAWLHYYLGPRGAMYVL